MKDENKTIAKLITELKKIRLRVHELEETNKHQKQMEKVLRASEDNLRTTLNSIGDAVIATDINGRITRMNPVAEQLTGRTVKDAAGKPLVKIFSIINEESRRHVENPVERVLRDGVVVGLANHTLLISKDGKEIPIADSGAPIRDDNGKTTGVVLVFRDQTEERTAQSKNARLATIVENSDDAIIGKTLAGIITNWNNAAERMYGYSAEEAIGKSISILIPHDLSEEMPRILEKIGQGERIEHFETVRMKKNGEKIPVSITVSPIRDREGEIIGVSSIVRDITERKQAVEKLQESEERFRLAFYTNPDSINLNRLSDGMYIDINRGFSQITGYTREDVIGRTSLVINIWHDPQDRARLVEGLKKDGVVYNLEARFRMKNGGIKVGLMSAAVMQLNRETVILSITRDITNIKRAEEALRKNEFFLSESQRIANLGSYDLDILSGYWTSSDTLNDVLGIDDNYDKSVAGWNKIVHPEEREEMLSYFNNNVLKENQKFDREYRIIRVKNNEERWVHGLGELEYDDEGKPVKMIGTIQDITERKRAEQALKVSESKYRTLFEGISDSVFVHPLKKEGFSNFIEVNEVACERYGYTREELLNLSLKDISAPEHVRLRGSRNGREKQLKDQWVIFEAVHLAESGKQIPVEISSRIFELEGRPVIMSLARDISERKQAEEKIHESEERFRLAFHTSPDAITISRLSDGTYIDINRGFSQITGYTREEVIGRSALEINIWYDSNDRTRLVEELKKDGVTNNLEVNFRMKNGRVLIALLSAVVIQLDKEAVILSIAKDITDRKRMEKMRDAQYNINRAMVTASDINTLFKVVRDEVADLVNVKNFIFALYDEKTGMLSTTFKRDEKDTIPTSWEAENSLTGQVIRLKKSILLKKKEINKWIKRGEIKKLGTIPEIWLGIPLFAGEKIEGAIVLQDYNNPDVFDETTVQMLEVIAREMGIYISRRKMEAERELLSAAIEQAAEVVVITDSQGTIEYVNPAFERLTGYSRREAIGQNPSILKSGEHDEAFYHSLWETISGGKIWQGQFVNRHKDLTVFTEEATISPVFDTAGKIVNYVAVKRDITRELELERQYQQAQRMESIGRLAGGVAHDFNNLLTVINGYATLIMNDLHKNDPIYADTKEILHAGERASRLTQQLLAFSRKQIFRLENFCLNEVILDLEKMLCRLLGEDIQIATILDENLAGIRADMGQVEQVIINLAVNARDAMPQGGHLTIETQNVTLDREYAEARPQVAPGNYVLLAISDTGEGMDQERQGRIFEPFFTTKGVGKGTGLGLATVYGILKQSGGFIWVYSEVGKGTTFKVYFPVSGEAKTDHKPQEKLSISLRGDETILLVEDENGVRNLALRTLKEKGYRVLVAKNGGEALLICEEQSEPIDLIVTDVVMPHMSGKQFVAKISKNRPDIKVIYTSGYTDNVIVYHGILDEEINFIHKPFSPNTLLQEVRKVLDTDR